VTVAVQPVTAVTKPMAPTTRAGTTVRRFVNMNAAPTVDPSHDDFNDRRAEMLRLRLAKRSAQQFDCHPGAELAAARYSQVDELNIDVEPH
jgi:hypothetical protein